MKNTTKHIATFAAFFIASLSFGLSLYAQNLPTGVYLEKDGVAYRKTATQNNNGTYTIDLEAFVTGKVQYTESGEPSDIVLVLDVSGSMNSTINSYEYSEASVSSINASSLYDSFWREYSDSEATDYYYKLDDEYYQVYKGHASSGGYYNPTHYFFLYFTVNGVRKYINTAGEVVDNQPTDVTNRNTNLLNSQVQLYSRTVVSSKTRLKALQEATVGFIREVRHNAEYDKKGNRREQALDHKIAIVKFSQNYYNNNAQAFAEVDGGNHLDEGVVNYTEVVRGLKSVMTDTLDLISVVNSLQVYGNYGQTSADYGMRLAKNIINNIPSSRTSNKTIVFFTDGEPLRTGSNSVAKDAINYSHDIKSKEYGTGDNTSHPVVFSVGVFSSKPEPGDDIYTFMDRISSNYPDATSMTNTCTKKYSDYYKDASGGAADLAAIFKAIAGSAASQDAAIDNSSVVTVDIISNSFSVPANAEAAELEVLVAPCTGKTKIGEKWYLTFGEAKDPSEYDLAPITPHINADTVSTTGFDFSANFCGPDESTTPVTYRGYKQIIRFKINVKDDAVGGPNVETNEKASGIYVNGEQIAEFNRPTVKLPVQIWIQKQGLSGDDSAVFTLYRCPFEGFDATDVDNNDWVKFTKVVVNAKDMDENGMVKIVGLDPDYFYKLKEDAWAFGYTYQDGGVLYTVGDNVKNPFVFVNVPNNIKFAEATARNVFKEKKSTTEGGDSGEQK